MGIKYKKLPVLNFSGEYPKGFRPKIEIPIEFRKDMQKELEIILIRKELGFKGRYDSPLA